MAGETVRRICGDPSSVLFAAQVIGAGSAFGANILAARVLEPAGRGELALLLLIGYFGSFGIVLGCDRSVVAVYSGSPVRVALLAFLRLLSRPSATMLLGTAVILALPIANLEPWRARLGLVALFMVTNSFARAVRSTAIVAGRVWHYLGFEVTSDALLLGGLAWLTVQHLASSALWMGVYLGAGTLPTLIWVLWWSRNRRVEPLNGAAPAAEPERWRRARREGLQLLPATLAHSGTLRLDRLVLVGLASTTALGLYATVATMTELIAWPLLAFADSRLGPWRQAHDNDTLSLRPVLAAAAAYSVVAVVVAAATIHRLLVPIFGERYSSALPLVVPLVVAAAVFGFSQLLITALTGIRRSPLSSAVEITGLIISVVAYVVLIGDYGTLGAAYGSLIGYTTCLALATLFLIRARMTAPAPAVPTGPRGGGSS